MPNNNKNNTEKLLNGQRLLWVERSSPSQQWWPALRFDNYGQALKCLAPELDDYTKTRLAVQFLSNSTVQVARLIGTCQFVELSNSTTNNTRDFFQHMDSIYNSPKAHLQLAKPMKIVKELLNQDLKATGQDALMEASSEEEEENKMEIPVDEEWDKVWRKLREMGWKKKKTQKGNDCWVFPGSSRTNGVHGQDYFNTLQELQEFVRNEYGWAGGDATCNEEEKEAAVSKTTKQISGTKRRRNDKKTSNKEDKGRVWGRPKKQHKAAVASTPENQKTKPQDPAAPRLDSDDDDEEEEDPYNWAVLWDRLKAEGWTAIKAGKYNKLHDWYYVQPRRTVEQGEMGKDYFLSVEDVILYCQSMDEQAKGSSSSYKATTTVIMPSPRKRSRKVRAAPPLQEEAQEASTTTSTINVAKPAPKKRNKQWWFHQDALPSFREVWNILHNKLHFRYSNGCYKLPAGNEVFATDLDMRKYLVDNGIPNLDCASDEDRTTVERWVTFVRVPVKDTNSIVKLEGVQEMTSNEATRVLVHELGFRQEKDGSFHRTESESFASLKEARDHFRSAESLAPPVQGRRRGKENMVQMSDDKVLEFRVWAALSRTPLPIFSHPALDDDEEEALATPTTKKHAQEEEEEKDEWEADDAQADVAMAEAQQQQHQEASLQREQGKENVVSEPSNNNKTMIGENDMFEYDGDDEVPRTVVRPIRVSLTPSRAQPMFLTQPEE